MFPLPLQFIVAMVAYAINERMARRVDYLLEEVRVVSEVDAEGTNASPSRTRSSFGWALKGKAARHLPDPEDGFLRGATRQIHDRDPLLATA